MRAGDPRGVPGRPGGGALPVRKLREPALAGAVGSGLDLLASWRARTSAAIRLRPGRGCSIVIRRRRGCTTRGFWDVNRMPAGAKRPVRLVLMDGLELNDPCVKPPIHRLAHGCSDRQSCGLSQNRPGRYSGEVIQVQSRKGSRIPARPRALYRAPVDLASRCRCSSREEGQECLYEAGVI